MMLIWHAFTILAASMLSAITVMALYFIKHTIPRIGFAIGSTAFVGLFLFVFTKASPKEVFAATAA